MEHFIDKIDSRKLAVFKYIENSYQQKVTIIKIAKELNISSFLLTNVVESLTSDFETYELTNYFQIQKTETEIQLSTNGEANSKLLARIYIKESPIFKIMDDIFKEKFINVIEFAEYNFLSRALVYKCIKKLKIELREHDIHLSPKFQLVGDETKIRNYFFYMYFSLYNKIDYPFSKEIYTDAKKLVEIMMNHTPEPIAETMKNKLFYFCSIVLFRQKGNKIMKISQLKSIELDSQDQSIKQLVAAFKHFFIDRRVIAPQSIEKEVRFLLAFIFSEDIFPRLSTLFFHQTKISYLTTKFIEEFVDYFPNDLSDDERRKMIEGLNILHFKIEYFNKVDSVFDEIINVAFINENYPEILRFCESFIENSKNIKRRQLVTANKNFLFNQYIFLVVALLPVSFFMKVIYVCVDFSNGKNYNQLIVQNLKKLANLNLQIEHHLTKKTNLLLTDYYIRKKNNQLNYLVWNVPPTPKDWANVANILIKIRNEGDQRE